MSQDNVDRLLAAYDAFAAGELERIPEFFDEQSVYRASGVFPGMQSHYCGHEGISALWHAATDPWEQLEIEAQRTMVCGDCVVAEVRFSGRGAGSGVEVAVGGAHLVRFRDGLIVEFSAFGSAEQAIEVAGLECVAAA